MNRSKRRPPEWRKLIVDGKTLDVRPQSRVPAWQKRLTRLKGITIEPASKEERKVFLKRPPLNEVTE